MGNRSGFFVRKAVIFIFSGIRRHIRNDRAESEYVSTVVYILVVVVTLTVITDVLAVIMTKQRLDSAADQVTRQIQLAGRVDADAEELLSHLGTDLGKADALTCHVDTDYISREGAVNPETPRRLSEDEIRFHTAEAKENYCLSLRGLE